MRQARNLIICALFFGISISTAATDGTVQKVDWSALKTAFDTYANFPTSTNAEKVIALLPKQFHVKYTGDKQEKDTLDFIYNSYQLRMLERQVLSNDRQAVRLAFNLMAIADGGFAEDLDIMLGVLIRINPKLFLEGLSEFQNLVGPIDGLVGNEGEQYVDRLKAQCYELQLRIKAFQGVTDSKLQKMRDSCIETLRNQIKEYCKDV